MFSFSKAVALLLPTLSSSFVIPVDPLPSVLQQEPSAILNSQYPYVVSYEIKNEATIQLILRRDDVSEDQQVTVTVPRSELDDCSSEQDTGLTVNGKALLAAEEYPNQGRTGIRLGSFESLSFSNEDLSTPPYGSSWALHCACLTGTPSLLVDGSGDCQDVGYLLNFRSLASTELSPLGFSLSFTQSPQPRLLHLSYLVSPNLDESKSGESQGFAHLPHWLSPVLEPIDLSYVSVSASSLFPTFSTTAELSFQTVTTPVHQATPTHQHSPPTTSSAITTAPSEATVKLQSPQSEDLKPEKPCVIQKFKLAALQVQSSTKSALQKVFGGLNTHEHHEALASNFGIGKPRNQTRGAMELETASVIDFAKQQLNHPTRDDQTARTLHIAALIIVLVGCSGCAVAWIRRDPRRRADEAARREERRNRRLYRRAACKYKWQSFVSRVRGEGSYQSQSEIFSRTQHREADSAWREKFSPVVVADVEPHGQSTMREELEGLRKAHGFVERIVLAEEGGPRENKRSTMIRHSRSYSDSLNSEKSLLPVYTEKDEFVVVDGQLRSSRALRELTPASSIIATSPQHSDCGSSDSEKE